MFRVQRWALTAALVLVFAGLFSHVPATAADNTWTNAATNLAWNTTSANWTSPTVWNNANFDSAIFGPTGVGAIALGTPITARALQFDTAGYSIAGSGANVLTLSAGGGGALGVGEIQANVNATIGAAIAGSVGLTKTGGGTLTLTGTNTYTGTTTIGAGILEIGSGGATGSLANNNITNNAALRFNRSNGSSYGGTITGPGSVTKLGAGTLTLSAGALSHSGGTTISDGTIILGAAFNVNTLADVANDGSLVFDLAGVPRTYTGSISGSGSVTQSGTSMTFTGTNTYTGGTFLERSLQIGNGGTTGSIVGNITNNFTLAFNRSNAIQFDGIISGTGSLTKAGAGTLTLTGANTYTGVTNINNGSLALTGTASFANSPTITIGAGRTLVVTGLTGGANHDGVRFALASGQTLKGTGTINGGVNIRNGATLAPGASPGTINVTGAVDFQPGSELGIQLNGPTDTDTDRSRVLLTGPLTFSGSAGNPFTVDVTNFGSFAGGSPATFTVASAGSIGSTSLDTALALTVGAGGSGSMTNASNIQLTVVGFSMGDQFSLQRNGNSLLLSFTPVPEPMTILAVGFAALGLCRWSRKARAKSIASSIPTSPPA